MNTDTYILVCPKDFFLLREKWRYGDQFAFIESVLKYLERYDIPHMHCHDMIRIYPLDLFHAQQICIQLRMTNIKYFENRRHAYTLKPRVSTKRDDKIVNFENGEKLSLRKLTTLANKKARDRKKNERSEPLQFSLPIPKPFFGTFIDFKPKL